MSERASDSLTVANRLFDPNLAPEAIGEFSTLFKKPRQLEAAVGQKSILFTSASLKGTVVGEVVDRIDAEAAERGYAVGSASDTQPVQTFELSDGSHIEQRTTSQVDGHAFALLSGSVAVEISGDAAVLQPGDVAFIEGNEGATSYSIAALPGSFATGLLIGTTERAQELAEAA